MFLLFLFNFPRKTKITERTTFSYFDSQLVCCSLFLFGDKVSLQIILTGDRQYILSLVAFCEGLPNHIQYWVGQKKVEKVPNFKATFTQSYLGCPESFLRSVKA